MKKKRFFASMLALVLLLSCGILPSAAFAEGAGTSQDGLVLSKTATANGDGTYTIRMEAYTTGNVITSTKTVPVDIVLVLDQSGSMAFDFDGNQEGVKYEDSRQYAMKQAMNNFIDEVNRKYTADADHRMAIVTFGSDASTLQGWTFVNEAGKTTLQTQISGLPNSPSGATNVAAGMKQAETLMSSGYNYTGKNTYRQKVVIVFTDGVPTESTRFSVNVANAALTSAKTLKDSDVTIYSVGIFNSANVEQLHGDCNGNIGDEWGKSSFIFVGDVTDVDIPAGNRFLNYLSSNFADADQIGLESADWWFIVDYKGWEITKNFTRTASGYYLTAKDYDSLNTIFQTISENIQSPDIDLGSQTVVKDTVSKYFDLPANTSDVKLYTAAAKADGTFESAVPANGVNASFEGNAVSVTGFDFNANFVSKKLKSDNTYGKKLIIEFTVTQKGGFLGGNNVVTNGENSGVYDKEGNKVEAFPLPQVNVPIQDVTVTAQDKNVYLLNDVTAAQLQEGAEVTVGGVPLDLSKASDTTKPWGLEPWQTEYVDITVTVKDKDGNVISDKLENLTEDTTYTVEVTVAPKTTGSTTAKTGTSTPAAKINLFKPELTFKDSEVYYGADAPANADYKTNNLTDTKWAHKKQDNSVTYSTAVTMIGTAPELDLTYTPEGGKVNTKQDIAVDVAVKINGTDVTNYTTFNHTDCAGKTCTVPEGKEFLLHVKTCQLTITKEGGTDGEPYVFTVYKDGAEYTEATIVGNNSVTIYELPVGAYTIKEDTGWSWRYNAGNGNDVTLSKDNVEDRITCTNTLNKPYWLNGFSQVVRNIFGISH